MHLGRTHATKQALGKVRDIYVPDLHIDSLKLKAQDFR